MLKTAVVVVLLFFQQLPTMPKNNPTGEWESVTGTRFMMQLTGSTVTVQIPEGSNPHYVKYEVKLENQEEINSYLGTGYFIAKLQNGKECRFDTDWQFVVVNPDRIVGSASLITPDEDTCAVKEKIVAQLDLTRKK